MKTVFTAYNQKSTLPAGSVKKLQYPVIEEMQHGGNVYSSGL
ncbi:hypothetical protein Xszus_00673 [Xenorhabdus szentirmaii]|uniref:Uncharacterized protein n=1 Tax=Xenorhabdus szentirmaii DSM 16338 TaxID=1427518 RepID=W1J338_9GAMM|nr:hypothetical protein Xsze_03442 [Xenorhabdus szentirmaii DSM 16338]PHM40996.1 hypothetical protein Xszus_00673 [Xenorhabdus szentirmaii]CDL84463.1 hypothetical protein XSR1_470005 [Xenorhabdus szentirmaii DSM 16338]